MLRRWPRHVLRTSRLRCAVRFPLGSAIKGNGQDGEQTQDSGGFHRIASPVASHLKRFPVVEDARLSKGQSNVEVYYNLDTGKANSNEIELENHGPFQTLPPGGTMEMNESLTVAEYTGEPTPAAHIAFLNALGLGSQPAAPTKR